LLAGEEVADPESGGRFRLQFPPARRVPVYVAAASPRALRLAGRAADGVVACVGVDRRLVEAARGHVADGARAAGRDPDEIRVVLWTALAVEDDGDGARDLVRAFAASVVIAPLVGDLDPEEHDAIDAIRKRYDYRVHMRTDAGHRALVPDGLVRRLAVAGTPDECRAQLDEILDFPIDQLAVVPFGTDRAAVMRRLRRVLPDGGPIPAGAGGA
jgi:5,10-methylenetetrahydromethanopterin reductase